MRSFLVPLIAVVFVTTSFAAEQSDYLPIGEGCEWTMNARIVSPSGEISAAVARRRIEGRVERYGKIYHRTRTWMEGGPVPMEYAKLTRKDEAGFYSITEGEKDAREQTEAVLPFKVGQSWQRSWGPMIVTDTVIGVETVKIAGKVYEDCYHVRVTSPDGSYTEDYWEAPKVGSVKSETVYGNGAKITLTLREFKAGK